MTPTASTATWALADQISSHHCHVDGDADTHEPLIPSHFVLPLHLRPCALTADLCTTAVPIIDLGHHDLSLLSQQMHSACAQWGLFHVLNHGISDKVLHDLQIQIETFLALPVSDRSPRFLGNRGEGYGTGFIRSTTGITEWRDCLRLFTFPLSRRNYEAWPLNQEFRKALQDFADETRKLQQVMLRNFSQNLGLDAWRLEEIVGEMQQTILMNHYPPCPQPELAVGVDAHTDVGAITCLWQYDDVVGLHVLHDGNWLPVSPPPGTLTIMIGDQVEKASNGIYKSACHRGVLNSRKHRVSMVSFYQLKPEQVVAPAVELVDDQHPPLYQATKFRDHELASKGPYSSTFDPTQKDELKGMTIS